jgi:hypothetical protein
VIGTVFLTTSATTTAGGGGAGGAAFWALVRSHVVSAGTSMATVSKENRRTGRGGRGGGRRIRRVQRGTGSFIALGRIPGMDDLALIGFTLGDI